jgi:hypothetical protein
MAVNHRFVVLKDYLYQPNCYCLNGQLQEMVIKRGYTLTITPEKKYIENIGWYFLIDIHSKYQVYISIYDFEKFYKQELICSFFDLDLELNYLEYKVNQALDAKDQTAFNHYSSEFVQLKQLQASVLESSC